MSFYSVLMSTQIASPRSAELVFHLYTPVLQKSIPHPHYPVNVVAPVSVEPPRRRADNGPPSKGRALPQRSALSTQCRRPGRGPSRERMKNAQEPKWREGEAAMERIKRDRRRAREGVTFIYSRRATRISIRSVLMNHRSSAVAARWNLG